MKIILTRLRASLIFMMLTLCPGLQSSSLVRESSSAKRPRAQDTYTNTTTSSRQRLVGSSSKVSVLYCTVLYCTRSVRVMQST